MKLKILSAGEMKTRDSFTFDSLGVGSRAVLEVAGRAVALAAQEFSSDQFGRGILVVTGAGMNGGDGYVAARALLAQGYPVSVLSAVSDADVRGDALLAKETFLKAGGAIHPLSDAEALLRNTGLIVDALFGTGFSREMLPEHAALIRAMNAESERGRARILSVDIPSGVLADSGAVLNEAVQASLTVCLQALKPCFVLAPGREYVGQVLLADIGVDLGSEAEGPDSVRMLSLSEISPILRKIRSSSYVHKGNRGHVAIVGGFPGKAGAVCLAARAALRAGAGLVTAIVPEVSLPFIDASLPELMFEVIPTGAKGPAFERGMTGVLQGKDCVIIGPGLGMSELADYYFPAWMAIIKKLDIPTLIDADGLNHLAKLSSPEHILPAHTVLTPHPGEAGRMLRTDTKEIEAHRFTHVKALSAKYPAVCLLKGAFSLLHDAKHGLSVCPHAHAALATGGSGDVLSGIIAAFIAQGLSLREAADLGVYLHGESGNVFSRGLPGRGVGALAHEIADCIPALCSALLNSETERPRGMLSQVLPPEPLLLPERGR